MGQVLFWNSVTPVGYHLWSNCTSEAKAHVNCPEEAPEFLWKITIGANLVRFLFSGCEEIGHNSLLFLISAHILPQTAVYSSTQTNTPSFPCRGIFYPETSAWSAFVKTFFGFPPRFQFLFVLFSFGCVTVFVTHSDLLSQCV